jgi:hypothetical protein
MRTRLPLAILALAAALLASACGSVLEPPAATVDGREIPEDLLDQELDIVGDNRGYRTAVEQQFQSAADGQGEGTIDAGFAARVLTFDVYYALVAEEVERRGLQVTEADREEARARLSQQLQGPEGEDVLASLPEDWRNRLIDREAELGVLRQALGTEASPQGEAAAEAYYRDNPEQFRQRCLSAVLVLSAEHGGPESAEQRAESLRSRIVGGEDFAAVARAESDDPQSAAEGGALGCTTIDSIGDPTLADAVRDLAVGDVSAPVAIEQGSVILTVTSMDLPPFDQVREQVDQRLQALPQVALNDWLAQRLDGAEVDVNPRYGRWVPGEGGQLGRVEPPEGPRPAS